MHDSFAAPEVILMKKSILLGAVAAVLFAAGDLCAQPQSAEGQAIVTVVPSHSAQPALQFSQQDIKEIKVDGKPAQVTGWTPLRDAPLELVLLIDAGSRADLGTQFGEMNSFIKELPSHTQMAIAWMQNGRAVLASPLASDSSQILKGLHLPAGPAGASSSPYFCLSDLARNWPSHNREAHREVLMISDGIDDYNPQYDPNDPYVQAAITDSVRAGIVVYSIFWSSQDRLSNLGWARDAGQNLLQQLTAATGGTNFWQIASNPISFEPYFRSLRQRVANQYQLRFTVPFSGRPGVARLDFKLSAPGVEINAPSQVFVEPARRVKE